MATRIATPAVELRNVTKNYGNVKALKGITLTVMPGEVIAFLGPNGAGKSTSISLMLGMRRPSSGSVSFFGENPCIASKRKRMGVMLQESGVPELLRVRELTELFGRFHDHPMTTQEALALAGLSEKANSRLGRLSGGEKQRLYFALALVGNPDVLFLDEPTSGLDVEGRHRFWDQINHQRALGKTIILTTHNLEEADTLVERILVIHRGTLIADGTPDEIKSRVGGKYVTFRAPHLDAPDVQCLPQVQQMRVSGNKFQVYTQHPEQMLATLFEKNIEISDLEVVGAGLEEAFLSLTSEDKEGRDQDTSIL